MALITCPECGQQVSDKSENCIHCGFPLNKTIKIETYEQKDDVLLEEQQKKNKQKKQKKKESTLSLIACILSLITCTVGIGLIVGIVDLAINKDDDKSHTGSKFAVIWFCLCIVFYLMFFGGSSYKTDSSTIKDTSITEETATVEQENPNVFEYMDCVAEYKKYEIKKDALGRDNIVFYFDFTNNSEEGKTFAYVFGHKAFYDGIEAQQGFVSIDGIEDNSYNEIKSGITVPVVISYLIENKPSKLELEISPFNIWDDKTLKKIEIEF